ncbi:hypothetical protein J0S82_006884, partial [Galemys pyrenaicus]
MPGSHVHARCGQSPRGAGAIFTDNVEGRDSSMAMAYYPCAATPYEPWVTPRWSCKQERPGLFRAALCYRNQANPATRMAHSCAESLPQASRRHWRLDFILATDFLLSTQSTSIHATSIHATHLPPSTHPPILPSIRPSVHPSIHPPT